MSLKQDKELMVAVFTVLSVITVSVLLKQFVFSNKNKLKKQANKDLNIWKGKTETNKDVSSELVKYWKLAGLNFSESQMRSSSVHSTYPWSSAYIGHLVKASGVKSFNPKKTHSGYVVESKDNRTNNVKKSYWAYKPLEGKKVEVGDIVIKGRAGSQPNLDTINSSVLSHGDIVVDFERDNGTLYAIVQGGNVSNTVKRERVKLTEDNKINSNVYFAQLKYIN